MEKQLELISLARNGDASAFSKLYETIYLDMYRFALYTLKNRDDAQDAVSETVVAAFEGISKLKDVKAFKGWMFKILSVKCKRCLKQYANKTQEIPEDLAEELRDFGEEYDVKVAYAKLSDEERLIVSMNVFGGYTSIEIGKILHMRPGTVRSKYSRALDKMETELR